MRRNRRAIKSTLNLYKDQKRELNYFGIICTIASANKNITQINIHKVDGSTEIRNVDSVDFFDNLKIDHAKEELEINGNIFNTEERS